MAAEMFSHENASGFTIPTHLVIITRANDRGGVLTSCMLTSKLCTGDQHLCKGRHNCQPSVAHSAQALAGQQGAWQRVGSKPPYVAPMPEGTPPIFDAPTTCRTRRAAASAAVPTAIRGPF